MSREVEHDPAVADAVAGGAVAAAADGELEALVPRELTTVETSPAFAG